MILSQHCTLRTLHYGNFGIFFTVGNAGLISSNRSCPSRHGKGLGRTASRLKVLSKLERLLEAFDSTTIQGLRFEQTAMQVV